MATYEFKVSSVIGASRDDVFDAWMSSERHSAMTGGEALIDPKEGGAFSAWNGYITGTTKQLHAPGRLVQTWRSTNFGPEDPDSLIEVTFDDVDGGTLVTIHHSNVPSKQRGYEEGGWAKSYFEPMKRYFEG